MFIRREINSTLVSQFDRSFVSPPGRHDTLGLRRLLRRAQLSDGSENEMKIAEEDRAVPVFHAAAHTYLYAWPGGGSSSLRLIIGM